MISAEATESASESTLRQLLAAVFTRAMDNPRHAKALEIVASRLNVVLSQLDYVRQMSTTLELPEWHRNLGAYHVADAISADVQILVAAILDARQAQHHPSTTIAVH